MTTFRGYNFDQTPYSGDYRTYGTRGGHRFFDYYAPPAPGPGGETEETEEVEPVQEYNSQPNQGGGSDQGNGGAQGDRDAGRDNGTLNSFGDLARAGMTGLSVLGGPIGIMGALANATAFNNNNTLVENILDMFNGDNGISPESAIASMNQAGGAVNPELGGQNRDDAGIGGFGWDGSAEGQEGADNEQAGMDQRSGWDGGPDIALANGGRFAGKPRMGALPSPRRVKGPGDGRSDSVPGSKVGLSVDEVVIPADAVSALGRGSSEAGAKRLSDMVMALRQQHISRMGALPPPRV